MSQDKKIFSKVKKRDEKAFIKAYDLYVNDIYRFVYFKVGSKTEAEDLTSTVFLKTWNYIQNKNIDKAKSFKALIYKIARNLIIDYYRSNNETNNINIDDEEVHEELIDENQDILKNAEINSDFEKVKKSLSKLKEEYREIIIMRFLDELSFTEIAQIIGKSKGNVRVITHRATEALKKLLDE